MTKRQRMIPGLALPAALFSLLAIGGCGRDGEPPPPEPVRPIKTLVVRGGSASRYTFPATVEAGRRTLLSFRVGGRLEELLVREGDIVEEEQLIARLDPTDFEHVVDEAAANYERAEADFRRYRSLYEKDAVSLADLDLRRSQREVTAARLAEARTNLGYTRLYAPFDGQIGKRYVENFQDVAPQQPIVDLNNTSEIELVVDLPEQIAKTLDREAERHVYARFDILPERNFDLKLKEISTRADPETQTFRTTLAMPETDEILLLPGMTGEVILEVIEAPREGEKMMILVPAIALITRPDGQQIAWVVDEETMTVSARPVQVGSLRGTDQIEILGGLENGERIAISGVAKLREGMQVSLWDPFGKGSQR